MFSFEEFLSNLIYTVICGFIIKVFKSIISSVKKSFHTTSSLYEEISDEHLIKAQKQFNISFWIIIFFLVLYCRSLNPYIAAPVAFILIAAITLVFGAFDFAVHKATKNKNCSPDNTAEETNKAVDHSQSSNCR